MFFLWELLYRLCMELNFIISPIQKLIVVNSIKQTESKNKRRLDGSLGKNGIQVDLYNLLCTLEYRLLIIVKQFEVEKEKEDEKLNVKNKIHILVHEQEMAWRMAKNALENMNQSSLLQFVGVPMS